MSIDCIPLCRLIVGVDLLFLTLCFFSQKLDEERSELSAAHLQLESSRTAAEQRVSDLESSLAQLESCLSAVREEHSMCVSHADEVRKRNERELQTKNSEVVVCV